MLNCGRNDGPLTAAFDQVATLDYIRAKTNVPVPEVYYYDSNQYNELGAEYIIMSKVRPSTRVLPLHLFDNWSV